MKTQTRARPMFLIISKPIISSVSHAVYTCTWLNPPGMLELVTRSVTSFLAGMWASGPSKLLYSILNLEAFILGAGLSHTRSSSNLKDDL